MSPLTLEQRVANLEEQVSHLMAHPTNSPREKPWLRSLGIFAGDSLMKEIFEEALQYRKADRERVRRRNSKNSRSSKSK